MPFQFTCPHCFKKTMVDEALAGKEGPCAGCAKMVRIPGPPSVRSPALPDSSQPRALPKSAVWVIKIAGFGIVCVILASVSLYLFWPSLQALKQRRDRLKCMANLRKIADALDAYAMKYGTYPTPVVVDSAGKPLYSWRVLILPQLGEDALYARFDKSQPWDSTQNAFLISECPKVFSSPQSTITTAAIAEPNYMLVTGNGTLFPPSGPLGPTDIQDGVANTLLVVETAGNAVSWTQPADIDVNRLNRQVGGSGTTLVAIPNRIGGSHVGGATAVFADGEPAWLPDDIAPSLVRSMISPAGGEPINTTPYRVGR